MSAPAGPVLDVSSLVMGLRTCYPHPTNLGTPRRLPTPLAIEQWLSKVITSGDLKPDGYSSVLDAAKREAKLSEQDPDTFRRSLKTWILEAGWGEVIETEDDSGPDVPPPTDGPRFTPDDWNQQKETHGQRLDDGKRGRT